MKPVSINCPNCGTPIDLDIDHLSQFCNSCGSKIVLDVETIQQLLIAKEETKRIQMDADKQIKLAQMQSEEKAKQWQRLEKSNTKSFLRKNAVPILVAFGILLVIILSVIAIERSNYRTDHMWDEEEAAHEELVEELEDIEEDIEEAIKDGDYDQALLLANKLRMDDGWSSEETNSWNEKREEYIRIIKERQAKENN